MAWHVTNALWEAYAAGTLNPAADASIESHVTSCEQCRAAASAYAPAAPQVWGAIHETINRPTLPAPLRALRRLGVPEGDLVILGASDALAVSWGVAVGGALTAVIATALAGARQEFTFLLLVPLVQVLAVMASFATTDSLHELATSTALSKLRVALLRTAEALCITIPSTAIIGLVVPHLDALAVTWVLPALGLVLAALVLNTWLPPWPAAGVTAAAWVVVVTATHTHLTSAMAQSLSAAIALALALVFVMRTTTTRLGGLR